MYVGIRVSRCQEAGKGPSRWEKEALSKVVGRMIGHMRRGRGSSRTGEYNSDGRVGRQEESGRINPN